MISLFAPYVLRSSEKVTRVLTNTAYCVHGFKPLRSQPGWAWALGSFDRGGGSTSTTVQLFDPHASWPSNSVTFWYGLQKKKKKPQINRILIQAFKNNISKDITESYSPLPFGESITISLYVFWKWSIGSFATQSPKSITDQAVLHRWSQQLNPG